MLAGWRTASLRACGVRWAYAVDPGELSAVTPAGSELGDAVEAIMLAVRACVQPASSEQSKLGRSAAESQPGQPVTSRVGQHAQQGGVLHSV